MSDLIADYHSVCATLEKSLLANSYQLQSLPDSMQIESKHEPFFGMRVNKCAAQELGGVCQEGRQPTKTPPAE